MIVSESEHLLVGSHTGTTAEWDAFVQGAEGSTICHRWAWRTVMEDVLGHQCAYLSVRDGDGTLRGVLPLVRMRSRIFGDYAVSLPFLNDGGPLGDPAARAQLAKHAAALARRWGVKLLELRSREAVPGPLRTTDHKVTVYLPLPASGEELWKDTFRAKLRSQIRRPIREGMQTRFGAEQLGPFYEVFARNMRDLGTPVHPRAFFERIAERFPEESVFAAVYHQGAPVAAGCGFVWHDEFEITWASSLREHNRLSPNMLLYAALMEHVIGRGVSTFNFGRCTPGGGTHHFKLQWGGHDAPLPWGQWSPRGETDVPTAESPFFQLASSAWQRLPLPVANRLGPVLARQIASF